MMIHSPPKHEAIMTYFPVHRSYLQSITSEHLNLFFISPSFRKSVILGIRYDDSRPLPRLCNIGLVHHQRTFESFLYITIVSEVCDSRPLPPCIIGTLRSEDGDGRENVAEKVNSRSFNLHRDYSKSLTLSNVGEPS